MKKEEILVAIQQLEEQLAALKELVLAEEVEEVDAQESVEEPEEREELPAPPEVIYVNMEDITPSVNAEKASKGKGKVPSEETMVGCAILNKLPDFYTGKCRTVVIQRVYKDNSDKVNPKTGKPYTELYRDRNKIHIVAEDFDGNVLGETVVHWNTLAPWHPFLLKEGINSYKKTNNPCTNGMPKKINICID